MAFRWPTDPPGKAPAHTKSWEAHNASSTKPAAAAPVQSPLPLIEPPDASFTAEIEGLGKTYRSDLVGNTEGRKRGLSDYGFTEDETTGGLTFDANNPFSRAALLKKNYDTQRARTGQTMAMSGNLYSGAGQHSQDRPRAPPTPPPSPRRRRASASPRRRRRSRPRSRPGPA
jgi:hypothetical protein